MSRIDETRSFISVGIAVLTVSDTRSLAEDKSGQTLADRITEAGHTLVDRAIVTDDAELIREKVLGWSRDDRIDVVITTGGTGLAPRDVTVEAIRPLLDKELEGFGEAFRRLSWDQVGPRAVLSRALAGSRGTTLVAALPGSPKAVELAVSQVLLPLLGHAVDLLHGHTSHGVPARPAAGSGPRGAGC